MNTSPQYKACTLPPNANVPISSKDVKYFWVRVTEAAWEEAALLARYAECKRLNKPLPLSYYLGAEYAKRERAFEMERLANAEEDLK